MNKFRIVTVFYICCIVILGVITAVKGSGACAIVAVSAFYAAVVIAGAVDIRLNFFINSVNSGDRSRNEIAVTFDDGPLENTLSILNFLREKNVKAAFFCTGENLKNNRGVAVKIYNEGHIIGNHTYSHSFFFDLYSSKRMAEEMRETDLLIKEITGHPSGYFRPPYGVTNPALRRALKSFNFTVVGWTFKTNDTMIKDIDRSVKKIVKKLRNGAILVFHDYNPEILQILEKFFTELDSSGYRIIPLDILIKMREYV